MAKDRPTLLSTPTAASTPKAPTAPRYPAPTYGQNLTSSIETGGSKNLLQKSLGFTGGGNRAPEMMRNILPAYYHMLAQNLGFQNEMMPYMQSGIKSAVYGSQPMAIQDNIERQRGINASEAAQSSGQLDNQLRSLGLSSGAREGGQRALVSDANARSDSMASYWNSPEGQLAALNTMLQAIGANDQSTQQNLGGFMTLGQGLSDWEKAKAGINSQQSGGGLLGDVLGIAGAAAPYIWAPK